MSRARARTQDRHRGIRRGWRRSRHRCRGGDRLRRSQGGGGDRAPRGQRTLRRRPRRQRHLRRRDRRPGRVRHARRLLGGRDGRRQPLPDGRRDHRERHLRPHGPASPGSPTPPWSGRSSSTWAAAHPPSLVEPRVAVVMIGANDVTTGSTRPSRCATSRRQWDGSRELGTEVVSPCRTSAPSPRSPAAAPRGPTLGRGLAAAQTVAVVEAGGPVSLGDLLGRVLRAPARAVRQGSLHPSPRAMRDCAAALLPSVCRAGC